MAEIAAKFGKRGIDEDLDSLTAMLDEAEQLFEVLALEIAGLEEIERQMETFMKSLVGV